MSRLFAFRKKCYIFWDNPSYQKPFTSFLVGHCEGSDCDNDGSDCYGNGHDDDASNYNEKDNDNDDDNDDGSDGCDTQANVIKSLELSWQSLISDKTWLLQASQREPLVFKK